MAENESLTLTVSSVEVSRLRDGAEQQKDKDSLEGVHAMGRVAKTAQDRAAALRAFDWSQDSFRTVAENHAKDYDEVAAGMKSEILKDGRKVATEISARAVDAGKNRDAAGLLRALADFASLERVAQDPASAEPSGVETRLHALASLAGAEKDPNAAWQNYGESRIRTDPVLEGMGARDLLIRTANDLPNLGPVPATGGADRAGSGGGAGSADGGSEGSGNGIQ